MKDFETKALTSMEEQQEEKILSFDEIQNMYGSDMHDDSPAVYCSTYWKYANGSLYGLWLDLAKFSDYDEFMDICRQLHCDEKDPEFMWQDFENFPKSLYSESSLDEDTFEKILEYYGLNDNEREAMDDFIELYYDFDLELFHERYQGKFDSEEDFADFIISECYDLDNMMGDLSYYFDYEKYARDLFMSDYDYGSNGHVFRAY